MVSRGMVRDPPKLGIRSPAYHCGINDSTLYGNNRKRSVHVSACMHLYLRVGGGFVVLLAQDCWNEQRAVGVTIPPLRVPRVDREGSEHIPSSPFWLKHSLSCSGSGDIVLLSCQQRRCSLTEVSKMAERCKSIDAGGC
jgi:hypothetical protein